MYKEVLPCQGGGPQPDTPVPQHLFACATRNRGEGRKVEEMRPVRIRSPRDARAVAKVATRQR